jgi:hypothetical protein
MGAVAGRGDRGCMHVNPVRAALAAAAISLSAAPGALAAAPQHTVFGGVTADNAPIGVRLSKDGKRVDRLFLLLYGTCPDGQPITFSEIATAVPLVPAAVDPGEDVFAGGKLARNGRFSLTAKATTFFGDRAAVVTQVIEGRARGSAMRGTVRGEVVLASIPGAPDRTCSLTSRQFTARSDPGRLFAGATNGDDPIVVELDARRTFVTRLRVPWTAGCPDHSYWFGVRSFEHLAVFDGAFAGHAETSDPIEGGGESKGIWDVTGRFSAAKGSGSFTSTVVETPAGGAPTTCGPSDVKWTATSSKPRR